MRGGAGGGEPYYLPLTEENDSCRTWMRCRRSARRAKILWLNYPITLPVPWPISGSSTAPSRSRQYDLAVLHDGPYQKSPSTATGR
jgi:hypothetical protein